MKHVDTKDLDRLLADLDEEERSSLLKVWNMAGEEEPEPAISATEVSAATLRLRQSISAGARPAVSRTVRVDRPGSGSRPWLVVTRLVAASVVIAAALIFGWLNRPVDTLERVAAAGSREIVELPDGSMVHLNSGSRIYYPASFREKREVRLEGEAYFDVQHDKLPLRVETFNATVQVLGTRFVVRAWPDESEPETRVGLLEGVVKLVSRTDAQEFATLSPGESMVVSATGLSPSRASVEEANAWRTGDLVFLDVPLDEIVADLERRFDVRIQVRPPQMLSHRLTLAVRQPRDAASVVGDLAAALQLSHAETTEGFELFAPAE